MLDVLFWELKASPVVWPSFMKAWEIKQFFFDQKLSHFVFNFKFFPTFYHQNSGSGSGLVFSQKCWIRIRNHWIRIQNTGYRIINENKGTKQFKTEVDMEWNLPPNESNHSMNAYRASTRSIDSRRPCPSRYRSFLQQIRLRRTSISRKAFFFLQFSEFIVIWTSGGSKWSLCRVYRPVVAVSHHFELKRSWIRIRLEVKIWIRIRNGMKVNCIRMLSFETVRRRRNGKKGYQIPFHF